MTITKWTRSWTMKRAGSGFYNDKVSKHLLRMGGWHTTGGMNTPPLCAHKSSEQKTQILWFRSIYLEALKLSSSKAHSQHRTSGLTKTFLQPPFCRPQSCGNIEHPVHPLLLENARLLLTYQDYNNTIMIHVYLVHAVCPNGIPIWFCCS